MSLLETLRARGAVDVRGDGETVVFVHGLGGTLNVWEAQVWALAGSFRTVRFDLRGSGRWPTRDALSVQQWVEDLGTLLGELDVQSAHLVGHSLGTLIAQQFAAAEPERVVSLALLGVNRAPPEARRAAVRQRADEVRSGGMAAVVDKLVGTVPATATRVHKPVVIAAIREMILGQDAESYALTCEAMAASVRPDLSALRCPILLLAGVDDSVSPPELSSGLAAEHPSARLELLAECGHWIPLEQHEQVSAALRDFLTASTAPGDRDAPLRPPPQERR